jgi:hypothetical protein
MTAQHFCASNFYFYQYVLAAPEGKQGSVQPHHGSSSRCLDGGTCDSEQPLALAGGNLHLQIDRDHHPRHLGITPINSQLTTPTDPPQLVYREADKDNDMLLKKKLGWVNTMTS